jgi:hypothetical protein
VISRLFCAMRPSINCERYYSVDGVRLVYIYMIVVIIVGLNIIGIDRCCVIIDFLL